MAKTWIRSPGFDLALILAPAYAISLLVVLFPGIFQTSAQEIPPWAWVVFVLLIDVAHVYGTLFRTYFVRSAVEENGALLWIVPLGCWIGGLILYSIGGEFFWTAFAYIAVFHFIRQQYGFMKVYSRHDRLSPWENRLQTAAIYSATLYPILYWHLHLPRAFSWFTEKDFLDVSRWLNASERNAIDRAAFSIYLALFALALTAEMRRALKSRHPNWPRALLLLGTTLSWYVGIVVYNGDMAFTATNVVSHGIPYMALTWAFWSQTRKPGTEARQAQPFLKWTGLAALFIGTLFIFAYVEEGLWDGFVWRDHASVFSWASRLPLVSDRATLTWLVPLLALPQATHYVLDGFVWKLRKKGSEWKSMLPQ